MTADERATTVRKAIEAALDGEVLSARQISERVGVREREVAEHLRHLERSLQNSDRALRVLPARCLKCQFAFESRERLSRPSRCPQCRSERIEPPRFVIEPR